MKKIWFEEKNVIISGASSGIGLETARVLIERYHCNVIGIARNIEKLQKAKELLGDRFTFYSFDVGSAENWNHFCSTLIQKNITPDILINNAGVLPRFSKFEHYDQSEINTVLNTNFFASLYAIKALTPLLKKSNSPAVINVASSAALAPVVGTTIYTASKAALKSFTECLQLEHTGMYVALVCPGFVNTDIFRGQSSKISDNKLIEKFCSPCDKTVRKMIKRIARKKRRIIIGADAFWSDVAYRLFPRSIGKLMKSVLKSSHQSIFNDLFKE